MGHPSVYNMGFPHTTLEGIDTTFYLRYHATGYCFLLNQLFYFEAGAAFERTGDLAQAENYFERAWAKMDIPQRSAAALREAIYEVLGIDVGIRAAHSATI